MTTKAKNTTPGIRKRHGRSCGSRGGAACDCAGSYEVFVYSARDGKKIRKSFPSFAAAKAWRTDTASAVQRGTVRAVKPTTFRQAADAWLAGARDGSIRNRSGDRYKPSAIRSYEAALNGRLLPALGPRRLSEITRADVQAIADGMLAKGRDPSTIRNAIMPLRAIFKRAIRDGRVVVNPTSDLELPAVRGRRDRIAAPGEAVTLVGALVEGDRALWATAVYAGLRWGELAALRWEDVDLSKNVIRVERSWDDKAHEYVAAKSAAGQRTVPVTRVLREYLVAHRLRTGRRAGLVFGADGVLPVAYSTIRTRASKAWKDAKMPGITPHECRHTYASLMIGAGVNAKALSTYMGHANISITMDRYGHLMPGSEDEAAGMLDRYLTASSSEQKG